MYQTMQSQASTLSYIDHGPDRFNGHVDNHFHPDHGYRGSSLEAARVLAGTGTGPPRTSTATKSMTAADTSVAEDGNAKSADDRFQAPPTAARNMVSDQGRHPA